MKRYLVLGIALQAFASPSRQLAERFYQQQDYKQALNTWEMLLEDSPENCLYVLKASELTLLLKGRSAALETLKTFEKNNQATLTNLEKQELKKKAQEFSRIFLLEEAQTHYLQAFSKANLKEWPASHAAISQALALEPGNIKVLELKAEIDKQVGAYASAHESLSQVFQWEPDSVNLKVKLAESHIFHGRFEEAKKLLEPLKEKSDRAKLALSVSLWEMGLKNDSKKIVEELTRSYRKTEDSFPAPLLWMLHRIELDKSKASKEAKSLFKSFQTVSSTPSALLVDGWDPYRLAQYSATFSK